MTQTHISTLISNISVNVALWVPGIWRTKAPSSWFFSSAHDLILSCDEHQTDCIERSCGNQQHENFYCSKHVPQPVTSREKTIIIITGLTKLSLHTFTVRLQLAHLPNSVMITDRSTSLTSKRIARKFWGSFFSLSILSTLPNAPVRTSLRLLPAGD